MNIKNFQVLEFTAMNSIPIIVCGHACLFLGCPRACCYGDESTGVGYIYSMLNLCVVVNANEL